MDKKTTVSSGITIGSALAITMSWGLHHSVLLAILHGLCSWIYVLVWCLS